MQNEKMQIKKISNSLDYQKSMSSEQQQLEINTRMNSYLLPKIHKTTAIIKVKHNENFLNHSPKIIVCETEQHEKRKKMAYIISDYLQNFRLKQKGSLMAVTTQKNKIEQKPIRIEGISHNKFIGRQHTSLEDIVHSSSKKLYRLKANNSFIEKIKTECKLDSIKARSKKMLSEPNKQLSENSSLKGFVLKAKKSVIDCKQKSKQKVKIRKKMSRAGPW